MTSFIMPILRLSLVAGTLFASSAAYAACPAEKARLALDAADLTSLVTIYDEIKFDPSCSDTLRVEMRDRLADLYQDAASSASGASRVANLEEALKYSKAWNIRSALGRALLEQKQFDRAAVHLQLAINRINDNPTEGEITEEEVVQLMRMASAAVGLAKDRVDVPVGRNGNVGGIFAGSVRGFKVKEVDIHVNFEFDSDQFTDDGLRFAKQFATALIAENAEEITLEGHTDPLGTDAYNLNLSQRRAEAMKVFLAKQGFKGKVNIVAKGESEPPTILAGLDLSEEQANQRARRVELQR